MRSLLLVCTLLVLLAGAIPAAANAPDESAFRRLWERTDGLVADGTIQRTWYWGPEPFMTQDEMYHEGINGQRRVQYWDKGRMEISNPNDDPTSSWYVSSGLLPIEMISGRIQMGDSSFEQRISADIPIAGDTDISTNPDAPTYADFLAVTTVFLDSRLQPISADPIGPIAADSAVEPRFGNLVSEAVTADGTVEQRPELAAAFSGTRIVYYDGVLSHNIPEVFWGFLQEVGKVHINGEERQDLTIDWLYLIGHPASEPYWVRTNIDGQPNDLMVQVYERRILTYNPRNAANWQVEMGNVGQHYYLWRYEQTEPPPPPNLFRPDNVSANVTPQEGPPGTEFAVTLFGFEPGEGVSIWLTFPDGSVVEAPEPGQANDNGEATLFGETPITVFTSQDAPVGVWALTGQGTNSGHSAIGYLTVLPPQ